MAAGEKRNVDRPAESRKRSFSRQYLSKKCFDEQGNVLHALSERGQVDLNNVQAVIKIFAKSAVLNELFEIVVGGRDDSHVDLDGFVRANGDELALLDDPQQLSLGFDAEGADLVEKNRPAVGNVKVAPASLVGPRESAAHVAEQGRLE